MNEAIRVRRSNGGETVETLTGARVTSPGDCVIVDEHDRPLQWCAIEHLRRNYDCQLEFGSLMSRLSEGLVVTFTPRRMTTHV